MHILQLDHLKPKAAYVLTVACMWHYCAPALLQCTALPTMQLMCDAAQSRMRSFLLFLCAVICCVATEPPMHSTETVTCYIITKC
jgi:hypothetical protein